MIDLKRTYRLGLSIRNIEIVQTVIIVLCIMTSCQENKTCDILDKNENVIQEYSNESMTAKLIRRDNGAFGYSMTLRICNDNNVIVETIGLRGEDYLPTLDSVVGANIYIHYTYPFLEAEKILNFDDVVIGDAIIVNNKNKLKFKYIFSAKRN